MRISEIFYSIQGEGHLSGVPSVFVRTSGCNLRCAWCDTPYASWNPEGEEMPTDKILSEIQKYPTQHVVLTGGEPMLAKGIHELARELKKLHKHVTIETAGTISPGEILCDLASISPKLKNSAPQPTSIDAGWILRHEQTRKNPSIIKDWISKYDFQLKFVIMNGLEIVEIEDLLREIEHPIPNWKVQIMPEGRDQLTMGKRYADLVETCRKKGYRFCDRLHLHLFGNTRGT